MSITLMTRVQDVGGMEVAARKVFGYHEISVTNDYLTSRRVSVRSKTTDRRVEYPEESPPTEWNPTVCLNSCQKNVPRSAWLSHEGSCPPNNGHALEIRVEVRSMFDEELIVGGTETAYSLEFYG